MGKNIFNGFHMLVVVGLTASMTAMIMASREPAGAQGKYVSIDKEAAVASAVFSKPVFNEEDQKKIISAITILQKQYTDQGYVVLTRETCKSDIGAIVLAAAPGDLIDVTQELADALHRDLGASHDAAR